jgi:hypothetical protein
MVKQECIPIQCPSKWRESLGGIAHAFAHTWENSYAMQLTTGYDTYLYRFEADDVRIICPLSERRFDDHVDIVTPFGFSGFVGNADCAEFARYWTHFIEQRGYVCGYIGLNPIFENTTYFAPTEIHRYNDIYTLDLHLGGDDLLANLSRGRKRQIEHWDEILADIVLEKSALIDFFLTNYAIFFCRKKAASVYSFSRDTLSYLLNLDNVLLVGAQNAAGNVEAVTVFAYTPYAGDALFNVSLPGGQRHSAALHWYGVNYLKSLHIPLLNLGGGVRRNDGIAEFKQRFGGKKLALGCLKQVYKPKVYEELCRRANVDHTDIGGYFPAYYRTG